MLLLVQSNFEILYWRKNCQKQFSKFLEDSVSPSTLPHLSRIIVLYSYIQTINKYMITSLRSWRGVNVPEMDAKNLSTLLRIPNFFAIWISKGMSIWIIFIEFKYYKNDIRCIYRVEPSRKKWLLDRPTGFAVFQVQAFEFLNF